MRTDISKLSFEEMNHYLGVFLQMGRVQLDSDSNEQTEISLRLQQRHAADTVKDGSPNHGFRVDDLLLLDSMDSYKNWSAYPPAGDPDPTLFIDYFDHRTGEGSVVVDGAQMLLRELQEPLDLSELSEIRYAVKVDAAITPAQCRFWLREGFNETSLTPTELDPVDDWRIFSVDAGSIAVPLDLAAVDAYGLVGLDSSSRYTIDFIKIDLPIRTLLVPTTKAAAFTATPLNPGDSPVLSTNDDARFRQSTVLQVTQAVSIDYVLPVVRDMTAVRRLALAARLEPAAAPVFDLVAIDATVPANEVTLTASVTVTDGDWEIRYYDLPQAGIDWSQVAALRWHNLTNTDAYLFAPVWLEMSLDNNLVIMGAAVQNDNGRAGRFYADGLAAIKEHHETYLSQKDLPGADASILAAPAEGQCRTDLAYLDVFERPVTYLEKPALREIALEGPDTCTRTQLVAQVRILQGTEVTPPAEAEPPLLEFEALPVYGRGVLSTKDNPVAVLNPCADPCEPEIAGAFLGESNRLFRIEVHTAGNIGAAEAAGTARFKWSRENAAVATRLVEDASAGAFSVRVEKPELFSEGDLIEIADDLIDLGGGPYSDIVDRHGELRRITAINIQDRLISWEDPAASDPTMHAALAQSYSVHYHAKLRRWDDLVSITAGDIVLTDGVVLEFGGNSFLPGDYWQFTTRTADRSVERLLEQPAQGLYHRYYKLATIMRCTSGGVQSVVIDDCRPTFNPLTGLQASDIAFDTSYCETKSPVFAEVGNVQEAIDAICRLDISKDLKLHNKYLHGMGVVCGLKVRCSADRSQVVVQPGYALDCEGNGIHVAGDMPVSLVAQAADAGLLDGNGDGKVCLEIALSATNDAEFIVRSYSPQSFWESVLEDTLIMDFFEECIESLITFYVSQFPTSFTDTPPLLEDQNRFTAVLNLIWQLVNSASGPYIYLSAAEDNLLRTFYLGLRSLIASKTYCAMFDNVAPFPDYTLNAGLDTVFGPPMFFAFRVKINSARNLAYAYGYNNKIYIYDLANNDLLQTLPFPGGTNTIVHDVAVAAGGDEIYAVGYLNNKDSVFATANINASNSHSWGPSTVVCDIKFVTLQTSAAAPNNLYAIGQGQGLYVFDPDAIPLTPLPAISFTATGSLELSDDATRALAPANISVIIGTITDTFDRIHLINLNTNSITAQLNFGGSDFANDIEFADDRFYLTANGAGGQAVSAVNASDGTTVFTSNLGVNDFLRLAIPDAALADNQLLISFADTYKVMRMDRDSGVLDTNFRIPVQIMPIDMDINAGGQTIYVYNLLSSTITVVDVSAVFDPAAIPNYTEEPPTAGNVIRVYRDDVIDAFSDLFGLFGQYFKDCFADQFLIDCPECGPNSRVYLGVIEIDDNQVRNICNFEKRDYVKSVKNYEYWFSTIPILPMIKRVFEKFACSIL